MTTTLPASYFQVEPSKELAFNYVPRKYLTSSLQITNITEFPIAFKIKTNAPKNYLVKPHSGTLPPRTAARISITMQPTEYNPQNASINDKFLITAVPLPPTADLAALVDPAHFTVVWDSLKPHLREAKLKVALKFEGLSGSTNLMDKANSLESSRNTERESLTESSKRDMLKDSRSSMISQTTYQDAQDTRDSARPSSLMASFSSDMPGLNMSQTSAQFQSQQTFAKSGNEQRISSQNQLLVQPRTEEKDKTLEGPGIQAERRVEVQSSPQVSSETQELLRKKLEELVNDKKIMDQKCQQLNVKAEEQNRMLLSLSEENTRLKSELANLKSSTFSERAIKKDVNELGGYQSWHLLAVAIIAMIFGAILGPR